MYKPEKICIPVNSHVSQYDFGEEKGRIRIIEAFNSHQDSFKQFGISKVHADCYIIGFLTLID